MYVQDQAKYSIVANRRRAIPAVQDGLKPVQRRSIYGAFKKGFRKPSQHGKSAQLTGLVMGEYHPHGNCQDGSTIIKLLDGTYTTLGELAANNRPVEILAIDANTGNLVPATAHSFRIGQYTNKIYNIIFSNGYVIRCTNNHPYLLPNGTWIKAEQLHPYMRLFVEKITDNRVDGREVLRGSLLQDIVYEAYFGNLPLGYDKHHKDFNCKNNTKMNFATITRSEHQNEHLKADKDLFLEGLSKGRERMFDDNSNIRYQTIRKNSILMSEFNKDQGLRRFKHAIEILKSMNMDINIHNYEILRKRGIIYNLPIIERLLEKYNEFNSFEDLVNCELPSIGEIYNERVADVISPISFEYEFANSRFINIPSKVKQVIDNIIDKNLQFIPESYFINITQKTILSVEDIYNYMEIYKYMYPFIVDIKIEEVDNVPMYDYTVDGVENMLIPIGNTENSPVFNQIGKCIPMISSHNSSIYDAFVSIAAWYKIKHPLMYGFGNWGNVSGASAAAERYTEVALSEFGYDIMIDELAQSGNIVDWIDTYTRKDKEPEYLPAKLPNLLINGAFGIGVGMSINVPSHNLGEVVDATINLIKNPKAKVVLIPDLIQSCDIINTNWEEICNTGRGSFKVRGKIVTEQDKNGNYTLRIISLPDQVTTTSVYEKILDMIADKQLPMVKDVFNSLKDKKPNIIIHLNKGADPSYVKQAIYAKTKVQDTISVNFEAVSMNGIDLERFSYKKYLLDFIDQRMSIKFRLYCNLLQQVMTKHLQIDALVKVVGSKDFDKLMNMIRKYNGTDSEPIIEFMIKNCGVSDIQAKYILARTLPQLSKGHFQAYVKERDELQKKIDTYMKYVTDDGTLIKNEIISDLQELKKKYNTPRLCNLVDAKDDDAIPKGIFKVIITERNYIRKIPDVDKINIIKKDNPKFILRVDNAENLLIFDNKGKVFNLPVHKIPITDRSGIGTDVRILIKNLTSNIASVYYEPIFEKISKGTNKHYLTVLTKSNTIKKLDIEDFLNVSPSGLMYSKIKPEDEVVGVSLVPHNLDIAICSGKKVLRCKLKDVPLYKRNAAGSRAMGTNDDITGLSVLYPDSTDIVVVTKNGKFNRFNIAMLSCSSRGRSGNKVIKLDSNDSILNIFAVNETDKIRLLTTDGVEEVSVSEVKVKSSIAAGTKMVQSKGVIVKADVVR